MKRLIKSEFYDSCKLDNLTYSCYKNPTAKEWIDVNIVYKYDSSTDESTEIINSDKQGIRGICHPNGDVFICAGDMLHKYMIDKFNIEDGLHFESSYAATIIIRVEDDMDIEYIKNIFNNCKSLYNYYYKDSNVGFEGNKSILNDEGNFPTIQYILDLKEDPFMEINIYNEDGSLDVDNIEEYKDILSEYQWTTISKYQYLTEDFMFEFKNYINWNYISHYQKLSEDFIREFRNKVVWYYINKSQKLSPEFREEFKNKLQ